MHPLRIVAAALLAVPGPAVAGDVTWTVRTASNSYGAERSSFSYAVQPGGTVRDAMVVANRGKAPVVLAVYAADGFTTGAGQLDLRARAQRPTGVGGWVHAGGARVTVAPGKTADVPFTVAVPANATPGDYVGGIVTSLTQPDEAAGINVERRLGIRIKLRVGGALNPAVAIENLHVDYGRGAATVSYSIHNTGNAVQSARQAVSIAGPFGWLPAPAATIAAPPELLPGESWRVSVPVHGVTPAFRLSASATITPLLTDASGSTTALKPVRATAHGWAVPWPLVGLVVVVAALGVLAWRVRRRRRARIDARIRAAVEEALRARSS
jgi:Bacterial protein of unknown function (DUF916)